MPGWKRDVGRRLDALIVHTVPGVQKTVKWNTPFYGLEGNGWFFGFHCFTKYVKVSFFRGTLLRPVPPGESRQKYVRYLNIHEDDQLSGLAMTQLGAMVLLNNLGKPRVEGLHGSDVPGLVVAGALSGVGLLGLPGGLMFWIFGTGGEHGGGSSITFALRQFRISEGFTGLADTMLQSFELVYCYMFSRRGVRRVHALKARAQA